MTMINTNVMPLKGIDIQVSPIRSSADRQRRIKEYWKIQNAGVFKKILWAITDKIKLDDYE